ncbi:MAG: dihydrofolate reductase [Bacteroidetes bacterium]|jgi:dihydrofolate reductase|nr:dihydrofolate reductase [Bacteroidota bacterium]
MITIIAAIDQQNGIGKNNQLLCHLPADLKHFKQLTTGHCIIMGRKTFESIGKPLPNRTNIIISRNKNLHLPEGCVLTHSLSEALKQVPTAPKVFIIGGAEIYRQAIPKANQLEITHIHHTFKADAFFPEIDTTVWKETAREDFKADEKNKYDYSFVSYIKRT